MSPVSVSVVAAVRLWSTFPKLLVFRPLGRRCRSWPRLSVKGYGGIIDRLDKVFRFGAGTAMTTSRHFRVFWAVFVAVMGTLCVPGGASAATGQARAAEMFRKGCCCVTKPASGCCCETQKPLRLNPPAVALVGGLPTANPTAERVDNSRAGSCPCGFSDPASPGSKSKPTSVESESDLGATLPLEAFITPERPSPAFGRTVASRGSPPRFPLYLRHSRLLI